jgi:hypothetical protein
MFKKGARYGEHEGAMNPFSGKKSGKEDEGRGKGKRKKMSRKKMRMAKGR